MNFLKKSPVLIPVAYLFCTCLMLHFAAPASSAESLQNILDQLNESDQEEQEPELAPFDDVMKRLDESKPQEKINAATPVRTPIPEKPDTSWQDMQDVYNSTRALTDKNNRVKQSFKLMARESTAALKRYGSFLFKMSKRKVNYTKSQVKWINSVDKSVRDQTAAHLRDLEYKSGKLDSLQSKLQNCEIQYREVLHSKDKKLRQKYVRDCKKTVKEVGKHIAAIEGAAKGQHRKNIATFETAKAKLKATEDANRKKQNRPPSPFDA